MLGHIKNRKDRGDTIVEVMIVLAILGFAISIAFTTANRSLLNARQAQENSEATAFVQSQVEVVRSMAPKSPAGTGIFDPATTSAPFCIKNPTAASPTILPATGTNCNFGNLPYSVVIYSCDVQNVATPNQPCGASNTNDDTFIVRASWPDAVGNETDTVTISYRVHEP